MIIVSVILQLLIIPGFFPATARAVEYYVTPTSPPNPACRNGHPCYTLQQYGQSTSHFFTEGKGNITLLFINGTHYLRNQKISFHNLDNLVIGAAMLESGSNNKSSVTVRMTRKRYNFKIKNVLSLRIEDIEFATFGSHRENRVIFIENIRTVLLQNVCFKSCPLLISYAGSFKNSSTEPVTKRVQSFESASLPLITVTIEHCQTTKNSISIRLDHSNRLVIRKSAIRMLVNITDCTILQSSGSGLSLYANGGLSSLNLNIQRTIIAQNENGILLDTRSKRLMKINIHQCSISNNTNTGLLLKGWNVNILKVDVQNSTISSNQNGAMFIQTENKCNCSHVIVQNCIIEKNFLTSSANRATGLKKSAAGISLWSEQKQTYVIIENVTFRENHDHSSQPIILQLLNSQRVTIKDSEFVDNHGSSIQAHFSKVILSGSLSFKGNIAFRGAGLSLLHSTVVIENNTNVDFINNRVEHVGGAIFILELPLAFKIKPTGQCFYQLPEVRMMSDVSSITSGITFYNNTSANGGDDIFGAALNDRCSISDGTGVKSVSITKLFHFHTLPRGYSSSISSDPKRVCLCDESGVPQCVNISFIFLNQTRYPGETFNLSLVLVGDEYGSVSGTVYASLLQGEDSVYSLNANQQSQEVGFKKCNDLEYSIHSTKRRETLVLTAHKVSIDIYGDIDKMKSYIVNTENPGSAERLIATPIFVNVTLEDCPLGFQLANNSLSCQCIITLANAGIENCEISNHTGFIFRSGTVWIMASFSGNESNGVVVHDSCPYHYCKEQNVPVDLRYPDTQCALDHSGILCGGCPPNLSLAVGSNLCLPCSNNNNVALFVFFVAAGFLLVIFIKVLDLTVAKGTINGLIFYSNIVWAYQSVLFPAQDSDNLALQFLRAFLAWINLDFGIETCFIQGLDAYWKTWLQFAFPVYVWLVVGFIIVTSHYFSFVAKLFGNNSVPVLATLFLLSYAKLVRNCITVLGFVTLHYPDHTSVVWTFDGNLPYFGLKHSLLFVVALMALLFLWLPYISTLLLVPWLKRIAKFKPQCWINRWKPFYDAYYGPLNDKHHYWVGLLLIIRGIFLVVFFTTSATAPNINILTMILTPSVLLLTTSYLGNVYKNKLLSLLENSFFVNMIFLGSGILCVKTFNGSKEVIIHVSVWFTFVQFVCIVVFHICSLAKKSCCKRLFLVCPKNNKSTNRVKLEEIRTNQRNHWQLRESLLEESYTSSL